MPDGVFEEYSERVWRSANWTSDSRPVASGSVFYRDGSNAWFAFTGDSVNYRALGAAWNGVAEVLIDGVSQGAYTLTNATDISRNFAFTGLVAGPHVLQIRPASGRLTMDAFAAPASIAGGAGANVQWF